MCETKYINSKFFTENIRVDNFQYESPHNELMNRMKEIKNIIHNEYETYKSFCNPYNHLKKITQGNYTIELILLMLEKQDEIKYIKRALLKYKDDFTEEKLRNCIISNVDKAARRKERLAQLRKEILDILNSSRQKDN